MSHSEHSQNGGGHGHGTLTTSAHATLHCLIGCMIDEVAGLVIGVTFGLGLVVTLVLAVVLAYVSGFALALIPVMRGAGLDLWGAMRVVWLGEAVSIGVMEIVMNAVDYAVGGLTAMSVTAPVFWYGLLAAAPAGFLAAWPVNYWLLKKELRAPH